ncbi:MAG: class I SAM-dependent methyltransferase [Alphaproteobacteria bacterium]
MLTVKLDALPLEDGTRFLDLGCGEGRHLHAAWFAARLHAVGVDLGFEEVRRTREGFAGFPDFTEGRHLSLAVADALTLPFADESFDVIVCSEVLEHIPDYEQALGEINRILKPGGRLAVSVPRYWPEWLCWKLSEHYHNTPGGHVRIFKPRRLRRDVEGHGFAFRKGHWAHGLHSPYWWLKCAFWERRETLWLIRQYHNLLVWDMMKRPFFTRALEALAAPLMGKSVVMYFDKAGAA